MAIYRCYRHGRVEVTYLEIGKYGDFSVVVICPGGGSEHSMVLEPEKKTDEVP